jgi:TonB family protein
VSALGPDSLLAAESAYFLGKVHFSDRKYRNAEKSLLAALDGYPIDTPTGHERQLLTRALLVQTYEYLGDSGRATEHCRVVGQMNMLDPERKIQPLFRLAAQYPIDMLARRKEGHVDVGFIVDEDGFVRNPRILTRSGGESFERAALEAVERFRYAPKFVNGQAVETPHVRTRVTFRIQ